MPKWDIINAFISSGSKSGSHSIAHSRTVNGMLEPVSKGGIFLFVILEILKKVLKLQSGFFDFFFISLAGMFLLTYLMARKQRYFMTKFLFILTPWIVFTLLACRYEEFKDDAVAAFIVWIFLAAGITSFRNVFICFALSVISVWIFFCNGNGFFDAANIKISINYTAIMGIELLILFFYNRQKLFNLIGPQNVFDSKKDKIELPSEYESVLSAINRNYSLGLFFRFFREPGKTGRFVFLSESVSCLYNISPEEGIADPSLILSRINKNDLDSIFAAEDEALNNSSYIKKIVRIMEPSGGQRWSLIISVPRSINDGSVYFDGAELIITDQKNTEDSLRNDIKRCEYKTRAIFDLSSMFLALLDPAGNILDINRTGLDFMETRLADVKNKPFREFCPAELHDEIDKAIQKALKDGIWTKETYYRGKNGRNYFIDLKIKAYKDENKNALFLVVEGFDLTHLKKATDSLKLSLKRNQRQQAAIAAIAASPHLSSGDIPNLAVQMTELAAEAVGAEEVVLLMCKKNTEEMTVMDTYNSVLNHHSSEGVTLVFERYHEAYNSLNGLKYLAVDNTVCDPRIKGFYEKLLKPCNVKSSLTGFIYADGLDMDYGLLCFLHKKEQHNWEPDEILFICHLADQVALALSNRERHNAEKELHKKSRFQEVLLNMAAKYIGLPFESIDAAVQCSLKEVGDVFEADKVLIFKNNSWNSTADANFEWTREGITPIKSRLQGMNFSLSACWTWESLIRGDIKFINDLDSALIETYKKIPFESGSKSCVIAPLIILGDCYGFVCIAWEKTRIAFSIDEMDILKVFCLMLENLMARKQAEDRLRILSLAVDQSPVSVVLTDLNSNIQYVNRHFTEVTGYNPEEVVGKTPMLWHSEKTPKEVYKDLESKIFNGKEWKGELYCKKKNGDHYCESISVVPILNLKGEITHYLDLKEDITEKKEYSRYLVNTVIETEEKERLRYATELHDGLGPILSTIKLYFQLLLECSDRRQRETLHEKIAGCIDESIQTIKEISHNLSPNVLNNFGLIAGVQNYINLLNETQILKIVFNTNSNRRFTTNTEIAIYRVITELINNTLKYSGASEVMIVLNYSEVRSILQLEYSDNGCGFDMDEVIKARKGLGLSNIQQRISSINGKINFKSACGKGFSLHAEVEV